MFELAQFYLIFLTALNCVRQTDDFELVVKMLLVVLGLQSAIFLLQTYLGFSFTPTGQVSKWGMRATGTVGWNPSSFATFMEPLVFIAYALSRTRERYFPSLAPRLLFLAGIVCIVLTLNRSSWSGLVLGLIFFELVVRRRDFMRLNLHSYLGFVLGAATLLILFSSEITSRMSMFSEDLEIRFDLNEPAKRMIAANPVLGVGPGAYGYVVRNYLSDHDGWLYFVHNEYLLIWAERGTLGILAWVLWFHAGLRQARRALNHNPQPFQALAVGSYAGFVVLLWELLWNSYESFSSTSLIWFLFGLLMSTNEHFKKNHRINGYHHQLSSREYHPQPESTDESETAVALANTK